MIRLKFFLVFACCLAELHPTFSQSVKWSQPLANDRKLPYLKILGSDGTGYYLLRSNYSFTDERGHIKSRKYELEYFNDDLRLKWSQPIFNPCQDCRIADIAMAGSNIIVLVAEYIKKQKLLRAHVQLLDDKGKAMKQPVLLLELDADKVDDSAQPDLVISHDEHLLACSYRTITKDKEEQLYSVVAFDTTLSIVYKKEINLPVKAKRFNPITSVLTNEGNFFLLGLEFTTDKKVKNPGESFYKLISYNKARETVSTNEIKLENQFLTDVGISADNLNKKIVVAGFYSDKTTYSTAGVFYYSLTEDSLQAIPTVTSAFTTDFIRKLALERKENNKELTDFTISRILLRKDGGAAIIAESFYTSSSSYWDYYMQMWVYHYYYRFGNIISLSINPKGTILWSNVITKDQNSTDDGGYFSSFLPAVVNGRFIAIYDKFVTSPTSVLMTSISGAGVQTTKTLFNESERVSVVPRSAKQVDEETILIPALKEETPYLLILSF